ncbi:MAG: hypothetical protein WCZ86_15095 [Desulfurivibrionaceae bacterium]
MKMSVANEMMADAPVHGLLEDFLRAADDFGAMQQEHRAALLAGECKDLLSWRQSREQSFRGLARMLERVVACGQDNHGCIVRVREIMAKLLADEDVLQQLVLGQQLKLKDQLQAMRKGKEALQGYNINKGLVPRPRYLSSRM